jgi:hypothetical protein
MLLTAIVISQVGAKKNISGAVSED